MKILVCYDSSKASENALKLAKKHAKAFSASVEVVTSADRTRSEKDLPGVEEAERGLSDAQQYFDKDSIPCQTHLLIRGYMPGEDIVTFAQETEVDEIIIGVMKQSKVGKFIMGSTAQYVILKAPCPVVTVKA